VEPIAKKNQLTFRRNGSHGIASIGLPSSWLTTTPCMVAVLHHDMSQGIFNMTAVLLKVAAVITVVLLNMTAVLLGMTAVVLKLGCQ
jgi:hypothetical protein